MNVNLEQIREVNLNDDCIALVCYVDVEKMPPRMIDSFLKKVSDSLDNVFRDRDIKIIVLPSTCKLEVVRKTIDTEVTVNG